MAEVDLYQQSNLDNWAFRSFHVGLDEGGKNTNPVTAENVMVAAGPPRLSQIGEDFGDKVFPLGMIENVSIGQQKMLQPIREIGSRRAYIIGGYSTGNLMISRVLYSHASLLRVLTAANDDQEGIDNPAGANAGQGFDGQDSVANLTAEKSWYINLQSELFDRPVGLMFYMLDQRNNPYGAMYAEEVMVQSHNMALASQGLAVAEQVSMMFDRIMPVAATTG